MSKIEQHSFSLKLKTNQFPEDPNQLNWNQYLTSVEMKAGNDILNILQKQIPTMFERASLEPSNIEEEEKDPYILYISSQQNSNIFTDGIVTDGEILRHSGKESMKQKIIKGYNYIVIQQNFPPKTKGASATKYIGIVTKSAKTRFYVKFKLGMAIS